MRLAYKSSLKGVISGDPTSPVDLDIVISYFIASKKLMSGLVDSEQIVFKFPVHSLIMNLPHDRVDPLMTLSDQLKSSHIALLLAGAIIKTKKNSYGSKMACVEECVATLEWGVSQDADPPIELLWNLAVQLAALGSIKGDTDLLKQAVDIMEQCSLNQRRIVSVHRNWGHMLHWLGFGHQPFSVDKNFQYLTALYPAKICLDQLNDFDEGERHAWQGLCRNYPHVAHELGSTHGLVQLDVNVSSSHGTGIDETGVFPLLLILGRSKALAARDSYDQRQSKQLQAIEIFKYLSEPRNGSWISVNQFSLESLN